MFILILSIEQKTFKNVIFNREKLTIVDQLHTENNEVL
jgi:hypothetical protein